MDEHTTEPPKHLEKKCYQLIIGRLNGNAIDSPDYQQEIYGLVDKGIGGFILFGGIKENVKNFISSLQSVAGIPLFFASDIEQGVGHQVAGSTVFPSQMAVSAAIRTDVQNDREVLSDMVHAIAEEARDIGINMPLIPVLDINKDPDNPIICTRAFSDDPERVSWFGLRYIRILEESGLISCAKHFPGHGDTSTDSHLSLPIIMKTVDQLRVADLVPFTDAIRSGVRSIMIGHLSLPAIDSKPASISHKIISGLLRESLGFQGLILTDALTMHALDNVENVSTQCMKSGADILLHPHDPDFTVRELLQSVEREDLSEHIISAAVNRIMNTKKRLPDVIGSPVQYEEHRGLSRNITRMSITALKHNDRILPLTKREEIDVFFIGDDSLAETSPLRKFFKHCHIGLGDETPARFAGKTVLFIIFTSVEAWKGNAGVREGERKRIHEITLQSRNSVIVSFGCPYVLRHFSRADLLVAAYDVTDQAQEAVLDCLIGTPDFQGSLPVDIHSCI